MNEGARIARPPPTRGMTLQPISYRGRTVAAATRTRFFLADVLDERPADEAARRYARACLVPAELLERAELEVERAARALQLPACELRAARAEHAPLAAAPW